MPSSSSSSSAGVSDLESRADHHIRLHLLSPPTQNIPSLHKKSPESIWVILRFLRSLIRSYCQPTHVSLPPSFLLLKISLLVLIISSEKRTLQEIETEMLAKAVKPEGEQQLFTRLHQFEQHEQPPRRQDLLAQQQLHQQPQRQLLQDEERCISHSQPDLDISTFGIAMLSFMAPKLQLEVLT